MSSVNGPTKTIKCTSCFKSVGVKTRMDIYTYLAKKTSASVSDIVKQTNLTQPTVSYHLREMKENGLLKNERRGKEVIYSLSSQCPHHTTTCVLHGIKFPH